mgnify:CR=1 FL=1
MALTTLEILALPKNAFALPKLSAQHEKYIAQEIHKTRPRHPNNKGQFSNLFAQKIGKKGGETEGEKRKQISNQRRKEICTRNDYFTAEELAEIYNIHISTIRKDLTALYQCGMVTRKKIDTSGRHANFFYQYRGAMGDS